MPVAASSLSALLETPPMPRSQPKEFGRWLSLILKVRSFAPQTLAKEAEIPVSQLMQMIEDPSATTKGMRRSVYEAVLRLVGRHGSVADAAPAIVERRALSVYFTGRHGEHTGKCLNELQDAIRDASHSVKAMVYVLYAPGLLYEMEAAHSRGVRVEIIYDAKACRIPSGYPGICFIPDRVHKRAHNKILIVDDELVFTGSFNFTLAADQANAENLVVIRDPPVVRQYVAYWQNTHRGLTRGHGYGATSASSRRIRDSLPTGKNNKRLSPSGR